MKCYFHYCNNVAIIQVMTSTSAYSDTFSPVCELHLANTTWRPLRTKPLFAKPMPCIDDPKSQEKDISRKNVLKKEQETQDKIDNLTRMLCQLCEVTINNIDVNLINADHIKEWYKKHKDWDKKRLAEAKKSALSKLTVEEIEALGL